MGLFGGGRRWQRRGNTATDAKGHRKRVYDTPATRFDRLLAAEVLSPVQESESHAYRDGLNPAKIARRIQTLQDRLTGLAREKTLILQAATEKPLPDTERKIRLRPAS